MGYDTWFRGGFVLDRPLAVEHKVILDELNRTPHVPGEDGKPGDHMHSYCQWRPTEDGTRIEWDEGEKFYCWREWLEYIIKRYLRPWDYTLNGEMRWRGDFDMEWEGQLIPDSGVIYIRNNVVEAVPDQNPGPSWDRKYVPV